MDRSQPQGRNNNPLATSNLNNLNDPNTFKRSAMRKFKDEWYLQKGLDPDNIMTPAQTAEVMNA